MIQLLLNRYLVCIILLTFSHSNSALGDNYFRVGDCLWKFPENSITEPMYNGLSASRVSTLPEFENRLLVFMIFYDSDYSNSGVVCVKDVGNMCLLDKIDKTLPGTYLYSSTHNTSIIFSGIELYEVENLYTGLCEK